MDRLRSSSWAALNDSICCFDLQQWVQQNNFMPSQSYFGRNYQGEFNIAKIFVIVLLMVDIVNFGW